MLSTIREFALERLEQSGEAAEFRNRHLGWLCGRVEALASGVFGPQQRETLDVYEREHDNLRAALDWALREQRTESALRILAASWRFWQIRGYLTEAREQAERILALPDVEEHPARLGPALEAAGGITYWQADLDATKDYYGRALVLARATGDERTIANALYNKSFGYTVSQSDQELARAEAGEALEIYRRLGDEMGQARSLWALANTYYFFVDLEGGIAPAEEALAMFRRLGDRFMTGWSLYMLALYHVNHDRPRMRALLREALPIFVESDDRSAYGLVFDGFATLAFKEGQLPTAMRLAGFAAANERASGTGLAVINREQAGFFPETFLDRPDLAAAFAEGQQMSIEAATALALEDEPAGSAAGEAQR